MPNWVDNTLIVSGDPKCSGQFVKFVSSEESCFDFNKILPYPDSYQELDNISPDAGYNAGGHDWFMDNWGTKLPADEVECNVIDQHHINYIFITGWSPPTGIIKHLALQYPDLSFNLETTDSFDGVALSTHSTWMRI